MSGKVATCDRVTENKNSNFTQRKSLLVLKLSSTPHLNIYETRRRTDQERDNAVLLRSVPPKVTVVQVFPLLCEG